MRKSMIMPCASDAPFHIAAFYRFTPVEDPLGLRARLHALGEQIDLKGTLIIAPEGVNGTIAGQVGAVEQFLAQLQALPGCADLRPKRHTAEKPPFARWKVKAKREIVTMGDPGIDAAAQAGAYVDPADWNALIADPDVVLIDARNAYEVALGSFDGARNPGTRSFGEFPAWFDAQMADWETDGRKPRIAMFCTGGIRCEKSTALARLRGFEEVYHLRGGVLAYLEQVPERESLWRGDCFLFDERVTLTQGLTTGTQTLCAVCGQAVADAAGCPCRR